MTDPGGAPVSTPVTCSQPWLSGAHWGKWREERGGGENEMEDRDTDGKRKGGMLTGREGAKLGI